MKTFPFLFIFLVLLASYSLSAQTRQSDREFLGLKGKVKTVLTERADANIRKGKLVESKRRKAEAWTFRQDGSSLTYKLFQWDTGEIFESTRYFLIDGDKVSTSTIGPSAITIKATSPEDKPVKPSDPRYDFKLKYQFDDKGRIIEESWWQSDGDRWLRYVYEYPAGERHESMFDANGALSQNYVYKLDAKGNETEMTAFDTSNREMEGNEKYEYLLFDRQGNWTKRIEYQADHDSNFKLKVREVKYRTITYYP